MLDVDKLISTEMPEVKMIMQVHDELVFEAPKKQQTSFKKI